MARKEKYGGCECFEFLRNGCLRLSGLGTFLSTFQIGLNHGQFTGDLYKRHIHTVSLYVPFLSLSSSSLARSFSLSVSPVPVSTRHLGQDRRSRASILSPLSPHHRDHRDSDRLDVALRTERARSFCVWLLPSTPLSLVSPPFVFVTLP